ncbi:MAG: type II toxin-antitoxin system HicA family toxin [Dehalococcoidia bacterium]|nr:type II toxin-antitoxin system HicA family toxin [Dehalococcoidia bacterium]
MPGEVIDWRRELARAGSHTQRTLIELALRAGWVERPHRGKGSHRYFVKAGVPRGVTIQASMRVSTARAVIRQLQGGPDA